METTDVKAKARKILQKGEELKASCLANGITPQLLVEDALVKAGYDRDVAKSQVASLQTIGSDEKSKIITDLTVFLATQKLSKNLISYRSLIPLYLESENVQNGVLNRLYTDYSDYDDKSGYDAIVIGDFNATEPKNYSETYAARKEIHKDFKLYDTILNDVTKTPELFMAACMDLSLNLVQPMEKAIYKLGLQAIASPLHDFTTSKTIDPTIDISAELPDMTINATSLEEVGIALQNLAVKLEFPSRTIFPTRFLPTGSTDPMEYKPTYPKTMLVPSEFINRYNVMVKAGAFNMGQVEIPLNVKRTDYTSTFEEYGGITGLKHDSATETYDFILMQDGFISWITHYEATKKTQGLPKMYEVINTYQRIGIALDKLKLYLKIRVIIAPTPTK